MPNYCDNCYGEFPSRFKSCPYCDTPLSPASDGADSENITRYGESLLPDVDDLRSDLEYADAQTLKLMFGADFTL